eukprot:gene5221-8833_t
MFVAKDLPLKETNTFKNVIKFYENKDYKKALNSSEDILKRFPNHAETLAMKGLIFHSQDNKEEGYKLVKQSLKESKLGSYVCWNVYGMMWKTDRNYTQAAKCYVNVSKLLKDNLNILKDLANMQCQCRDFKGLVATREKILHLKPSVTIHWIGFSIAHRLAGNYLPAAKVIDTFQAAMESYKVDLSKYESSELILYQNECYQQAGEFQTALEHLKKNENNITDKIVFLEYKGEILEALKNQKEAIKVYHDLLKLNCDNHDYLLNYQSSHGFTKSLTNIKKEEIEDVLKLYDALIIEFPKSLAISRIALNFAIGDDFKKRLEKFVLHYLSRTIPSLFTTLKGLYNDKEKVEIIGDVFLNYLDNLRKTSKLNEESSFQSPLTIVWTLKYLAHHYDMKGDTKKALELINEAIDHTPTIPELYLTKGVIYKHGGNIEKANENVDYARKLDLADRYLNTKATKYLIRCDNVEEAEYTIGLFAKQEPEAVKTNTLNEMQCMWFQNEVGNSYLRQGNYALALFEFHNVDKHFQDIYEDQYDFHYYALKKMALRAYLDMIDFGNNLHKKKFYVDAAIGAVKTYISLAENSFDETKFKVAKIDKKSEEFLKQTADEKKKQQLLNERKKKEYEDAVLLTKTENPLEKATSFMNELLKFNSEKIETHLLAIELFMKKKQFSQVLKSIQAGLKISPDLPQLHRDLCLLVNEISKETSDESKAMKSEIDEILKGKSISEFNDEYLKNSKSLSQILAASEVLHKLDSSKVDEIKKSILNSDGNDCKLNEWVLAKNFLKTFNDDGANESFKIKMMEKFPEFQF